MYATVRIYSDAAGLPEAVGAHREEILGIFGDIPGFQDYYIVKTGATSAISVTVCDDQAGAEATNAAAREYIASEFTDLTVGAPDVHMGEVTMSS